MDINIIAIPNSFVIKNSRQELALSFHFELISSAKTSAGVNIKQYLELSIGLTRFVANLNASEIKLHNVGQRTTETIIAH